MKKILLIILCFMFLVACSKQQGKPDDVEIIEDDPIVYDVAYEVSYNPVTEEADRFSYIIFSRDHSFFMSVNTCEKLDIISGTYFIEGDNLYIMPENYSCDINDASVECDAKGYRFHINNQKELVITIGMLYIAEDSVFTLTPN